MNFKGEFLSFGKYVVLGFILSLLLAVFFRLSRSPPYRIWFRNNSKGVDTFFLIADSAIAGGKSAVTHKSATEKKLIVECTLRAGYAFPFAGIGFKLNEKGKKGRDLSRYDYLKIELASSADRVLALEIGARVPRINQDRMITVEYKLSRQIKITAGQRSYQVFLKNLTIPDWWLDRHPRLNEASVPVKEILANARAMGIMIVEKNIPGADWKLKTNLLFNEIGFYQSNRLHYGVCAVFFLIYTFCYPFVFFIFKKCRQTACTTRLSADTKASLPLMYKKLAVANYKDEELNKILDSIKRHFRNPGFTIERVNQETGCSVQKISLLLKEQFGLSFKQYLNRVRVKEAKRLLLQTELSITDIAFEVGYNNLSNFYRVFKELEKCKPGDIKRILPDQADRQD